MTSITSPENLVSSNDELSWSIGRVFHLQHHVHPNELAGTLLQLYQQYAAFILFWLCYCNEFLVLSLTVISDDEHGRVIRIRCRQSSSSEVRIVCLCCEEMCNFCNSNINIFEFYYTHFLFFFSLYDQCYKIEWVPTAKYFILLLWLRKHYSF